MCGISGVVGFDVEFDSPQARSHVALMTRALSHRGPDQRWTRIEGRAAFGVARLAIRGLDDGVQPMTDEASGVMAACNGEIDNHHELREWLASRGRPVKQATDVAVILPLYLELGDTFAQHLIGAFAIAIWDPRVGRLLLARDRAGERPLFFRASGNRVGFATEIAALVAADDAPLAPSLPALRGYLQLGIFRAPETPFCGLEKVGAGEVVTIDKRGTSRRRYWRWDVVGTPKRTPQVDHFDALLREAVRSQTDVDVEYGVFLSGGLDSSLVAAIARDVRPDRRLRTYTVRLPDASFDEGRFAERVAEWLGAESVPVWFHPEDVPTGIAELIRVVGEPLADPAWLPTALLARRASRDVSMALVGEGADELFGGYPTYLGARLATAYGALPAPFRYAFRRMVERWPATERKVTLSFLLKRFVAGEHLEGLARHVLWVSNASPAMMERLGVAPRVFPQEDPCTATVLDRVQQWDFETSLAEGLLTKADRGSMLSGFELRAPFLDQHVMEFAASLPPEARVSGLTTKVFLKRYALRYLPRDVVMRRKRGLSVPLAGWLRRPPLLGWAESRLGSGRLEEAGVSSGAALGVLAEHRSGRADHARLLWTLLVLVEWLDWAASLHSRASEGSIAHPGPVAEADPDPCGARAEHGSTGVGAAG